MASGEINIGERGNGYAIFPNGLKICWGEMPAMKTGTSVQTAGSIQQYNSDIKQISFPIEFGSAPAVTMATNGGNNARQYWYRLNGTSTTSFSAILYATHSSYEPPNGKWIAIGT